MQQTAEQKPFDMRRAESFRQLINQLWTAAEVARTNNLPNTAQTLTEVRADLFTLAETQALLLEALRASRTWLEPQRYSQIDEAIERAERVVALRLGAI